MLDIPRVVFCFDISIQKSKSNNIAIHSLAAMLHLRFLPGSWMMYIGGHVFCYMKTSHNFVGKGCFFPFKPRKYSAVVAQERLSYCAAVGHCAPGN